jgi:hypothetical protein
VGFGCPPIRSHVPARHVRHARPSPHLHEPASAFCPLRRRLRWRTRRRPDQTRSTKVLFSTGRCSIIYYPKLDWLGRRLNMNFLLFEVRKSNSLPSLVRKDAQGLDFSFFMRGLWPRHAPGFLRSNQHEQWRNPSSPRLERKCHGASVPEKADRGNDEETSSREASRGIQDTRTPEFN